MLPLNFAILNHFLCTEEASAESVFEALKNKYGHRRAFTVKNILETIMTAEANGLLEESRYEIEHMGKLVIFYKAHNEGAATITAHIGKWL